MHGLNPATDRYLVADGIVDAGPAAPASLHACVDRLRDRNLSAYVIELTRQEVALPVVRIVVPELRHCWNRLGPGRLYDVPVQLGWLECPLREVDLNPRLCPI
jgi:hypothetical protein